MQGTIGITINRQENNGRYKYDIRVGEENFNGWAEVFNCIAGYYNPPKVYSSLKFYGVGKYDMVHLLYQFYPHGLDPFKTKNPYLRQGVAARVLTRIIEDSIKDGAKALDLVAFEPEMKSFIAKHGFQPFRGFPGDRYYKLLSKVE